MSVSYRYSDIAVTSANWQCNSMNIAVACDVSGAWRRMALRVQPTAMKNGRRACRMLIYTGVLNSVELATNPLGTIILLLQRVL